VKRLQVDARSRLRLAPVPAEQASRPFQHLASPLRDLVRVHIEKLSQFGSVLSPFMAANATFALKPGVWFLRVRFVIFAPDSRREPSPPSGRKSTKPTVQILEASSAYANVALDMVVPGAAHAVEAAVCQSNQESTALHQIIAN
jgi:hypothetical protein